MGASGFIPEYYEDYEGQFYDLLPQHSELIAIGYARAACGHRVVVKTVRWTSELIDLAEIKVICLHPGAIRSHRKKEHHLARFSLYICDMCSIMREALDGR